MKIQLKVWERKGDRRAKLVKCECCGQPRIFPSFKKAKEFADGKDYQATRIDK